jgi:hypothetical protein
MPFKLMCVPYLDAKSFTLLVTKIVIVLFYLLFTDGKELGHP